MKIALIKQDVYQDLYICKPDAIPEEKIFSSIMRLGPAGLFTKFNADFYIIKEATKFEECRIWEKIIDYDTEVFRQLKHIPFKDTSFEFAKVLKPGSNLPHSKFAIKYNTVDWSKYDVVISINCAIPRKEVEKHENTLWCYMIGEANKFTDKVYFGYDVCFNQLTRGVSTQSLEVIDFPYTFVSQDCIENLIENKLKRKSNNNGIYAEVNSVVERPVRKVEHFLPLEATGHNIILHHQNLEQNLINVFDAKYFVKIGGRKIRGNSVIEAISAGTLVLMNPKDLVHTQLLPSDCWVETIEDVKDKILYFDSNPNIYKQLLAFQKKLLKQFVYDYPLFSIKNALKLKRENYMKIKKNKLYNLKKHIKNLC